MNEVLTASGRAKELIRQILTFSRLCEQELKPISLSTIIKEMVKLLRASLPSMIEIRQDLSSNAVVMADTIRQVLDPPAPQSHELHARSLPIS